LIVTVALWPTSTLPMSDSDSPTSSLRRLRAARTMKPLEDEADVAIAQVREVVLVDVAHVRAVEQVAARGR